MLEVLHFIDEQLSNAKVPYEYLEWTSPISYPYFVGEYNEIEPLTESGESDKTFTLTGFSRGKNARLRLEQMREIIKSVFPERGGKIATLDSGSVVAIFYATAFTVPTEEAELYKIQINLSIKLWKV